MGPHLSFSVQPNGVFREETPVRALRAGLLISHLSFGLEGDLFEFGHSCLAGLAFDGRDRYLPSD